jgi:hypothetical protein
MEHIFATTLAIAADDGGDNGGDLLCSAFSSDDDEELFCLGLDGVTSSSDEEASSCCCCTSCHRDCEDNSFAADNDDILNRVRDSDSDSEESEGVPHAGPDEEEDEGFISFKFDDYPESVYEGVEQQQQQQHACPLYVDGLCLCLRVRANLNESVKSR